jgi:hypothetical protein
MPNKKAQSHSNVIEHFAQWKGINCKQSTRWQNLSPVKSLWVLLFAKKISCYETQQLILGTGTAIWWVTEPHCNKRIHKRKTKVKESAGVPNLLNL